MYVYKYLIILYSSYQYKKCSDILYVMTRASPTNKVCALLHLYIIYSQMSGSSNSLTYKCIHLYHVSCTHCSIIYSPCVDHQKRRFVSTLIIRPRTLQFHETCSIVQYSCTIYLCSLYTLHNMHIAHLNNIHTRS